MNALQTCSLKVALGGRAVLKGIDLGVRAGQWTCVVGPNGAGKSTLLKALAGLLPKVECAGEVHWQGVPLTGIPRRERARQLSWLGQGEEASVPWVRRTPRRTRLVARRLTTPSALCRLAAHRHPLL